ncbi:MAG: hypothetical protein OXI81_18250 [Paracoccaceae bacterium]|nr:hypothetical protein [Paracoccaceae bacterium]MDE2911337.1 hypothetical protein [Paracoccaceae bacterium]
MFGTHQERFPKERAARGIDTISSANHYFAARFRPAFNAEFAVPPAEAGTAFVPFIGPGLAEYLSDGPVHRRPVRGRRVGAGGLNVMNAILCG